MYVLGMDTSNYTTSICAVRMDNGEIAAESRRVLPVSQGQKGLRQSEALFLHVQQIPEVFGEVCAQLAITGRSRELWSGLAVSVRPRPFSTSYMPVFSAGTSYMTSLGFALNLPVVRTSHQEGHLAAAQYFVPEIAGGTPHFAVHLSGGTSDVLLAKQTSHGYWVSILGEGLDLHAGQYVDRVGVHLGLPFPAGPALETLAAGVGAPEFRLPSRVLGAKMSFSGPCAAALRALEDGVDAAAVAYAVEQSIANSVVKALVNAAQSHPEIRHVLIAGGVAANQHLRSRIVGRLQVVCPRLQVFFAPARYSSDNALGVATIGRRALKGL